MPREWAPHSLYDHERDLKGYGEKSLDPKWPNGAKIAVSFVINYEEVGSMYISSFSISCLSNLPSEVLIHPRAASVAFKMAMDKPKVIWSRIRVARQRSTNVT